MSNKLNSLMKVVLYSGLLSVSACASIVDGRSQELTVNTTPPGATCSLVRKDLSIATISQTPSSVLIEKTKDDITVKCNKAGYQEATYMNKSGIDGWVFGNILFGGLIGWAIDSAEGSDNGYDSPMNMTLVPLESHEFMSKPNT